MRGQVAICWSSPPASRRVMIDPRPATATAPSFRDTLAGTPYRFIRNLGEGAYGVVVEAEQMALRRAVVVKVLRPTHAAREDLVDRLLLEAQAIAALSPLTPHVVCVLDFGRTPDGRPYIVMEHLEGRSLKDELAERGAPPPAEAAEIAVQILEGLAVAHDAGILHRDIKPDNVFLHSGIGGVRTVKLIDFGLAKLVGEARERRGPSPLAKPTDEGVMLGTPRYFAPEQARGDATTASSDLYATGIVLYKMLAGHDPFWRCTNVRGAQHEGQALGNVRALPRAPGHAEAHEPAAGEAARAARVLRHDALERPRSDALVRELVGHGDLATTQRYAAIVEGDRGAAVGVLDRAYQNARIGGQAVGAAADRSARVHPRRRVSRVTARIRELRRRVMRRRRTGNQLETRREAAA
jgi:eukaryotic-like serine/threonine-protein kinase